MSVRFDGSTDRYTATTGLVGASGWTVCLWAKLQVDRNDYTTFFQWVGGSSNETVFQTQANGTSLQVWDGTADRNLTASLVVGSWYRLALVRTTTTSVTAYTATDVGATSSQTLTTSTVGAPATLYVGNSDVNEFLNGNIANLKVYTAALSQTEVETEWASWDAVRTSNLLRHHKFKDAAEVTDYSGNGNALTSAGTPTFDADNPAITENSSSAAFLPILLF